MVMVRPLTCVEISPLLVSAMAPPKVETRRSGRRRREPAAVRITPVGPTVKLPAVPFISTARVLRRRPVEQDRADERLSRRKAEVGLAFGQMRRV